MDFIITQENAQKIADYLQVRPYNEVSNLIDILVTLPQIEQPNAKEEETLFDVKGGEKE